MMMMMFRLVGGIRGLIAAGIGFLAGLMVMRVIAGLWLIPAAEAELRKKYAEAASEAIIESTRESRRIEEKVLNDSDEELRRVLRGISP